MLIDLAPVPGPGPHPAGGPAAGAKTPSAGPVAAFGAVLAKLDRALSGHAVADPARPQSDEELSAESSDEGTEGEVATAVDTALDVAEDTAAPPEPTPEGHAAGDEAADPPASTAQMPPEGAGRPQGASPEVGASPAFPAMPRPAAEPGAPATPGDRAASVAERGPAGTTTPAMLPEGRPTQGDPAVARGLGADAPLPQGAKETAAPRDDGADLRVQRHAAETTPAAVGKTAAERAVPFAPIMETVLRNRLSEPAIGGLRRVPDGHARALDAAHASPGTGFADVALAGATQEAADDRLLRSASAAAAATAREIAQQIGARITPFARGQFELMLAPAELGRLEIALREIDGVMTLTVSAERPETLELVRRHVELLTQELRQIAQRELSLHFGAGGRGDRHPGADTAVNVAGGEASEGADMPAPDLRRAAALDHLDLRL